MFSYVEFTYQRIRVTERSINVSIEQNRWRLNIFSACTSTSQYVYEIYKANDEEEIEGYNSLSIALLFLNKYILNKYTNALVIVIDLREWYNIFLSVKIGTKIDCL